jgi:hypothetical protein
VDFLLQINWSDIQYNSQELGRTVYSFPLHLRVLGIITAVFLLITLLLLLTILGSRIVKTKRSLKRSDLQRAFQPALSRLLFETEKEPGETEIRQAFGEMDLKQPFIRKSLSEEIIHLHDNFTGDAAVRLESVFRTIDLHKDSLQRLKSRRWHMVARGMRELALMNIREAVADISSFLEHKNEMLRYEARITIMKLSAQDPLSFLDNEKGTLSEWDQSYIYTMLCRMPELSIPDFSRWLSSGNDSIVDFSITMIGAFRQVKSASAISAMLKTSDERRRLIIVRALRKCGATQTEQQLIERYPEETIEIRDEIVQSFATLGSGKSVAFLSGLLKKGHEEVSHTVHIVRSLLAIGPEGERAVNEAFLSGEERLRTAILHAKDVRL